MVACDDDVDVAADALRLNPLSPVGDVDVDAVAFISQRDVVDDVDVDVAFRKVAQPQLDELVDRVKAVVRDQDAHGAVAPQAGHDGVG